MTENEPALKPLIERIRKGDQDALKALFDAMLDRVFGLAVHLTGNLDDAEEVTSDVFSQAWRDADRYDPERASVAGWLLLMTRSRSLDLLRRESRHKKATSSRVRSEENPAASLEPTGPSEPSQEDWLDGLKASSSLHQALEKLPREQSLLIQLAFFRGYTHAEIARHAELPLGTVKSHIRRGMVQLRRLLSGGAGND